MEILLPLSNYQFPLYEYEFRLKQICSLQQLHYLNMQTKLIRMFIAVMYICAFMIQIASSITEVLI